MSHKDTNSPHHDGGRRSLSGGCAMNQLRLDPLTGRWVVVSIDRAAAPLLLRPPHGSRPGRHQPTVPVLPRQRGVHTAPALETYGSSGRWLVRVVPNLYPAFEGDHPFVVEHRGPVFTQATAGGIHEVLVLSPEHDQRLGATSPTSRPVLVMAAIRDRIEEHSTVPGLRYSQAIVNAGPRGGRLDRAPPRPAARHVVRSPRARRGAGRIRPIRRPVPAVHHRRRRGGRRAPRRLRRRARARGLPLLERQPLRDAGHPPDPRPAPPPRQPGGPRRPWAGRCAPSWARSGERLGDVAYNIVFHSAPYRAPEPYHWHVHVWPKLTTAAGFELGTGVLINIVPPEQATEELRVAVPA